MSDSRSYIGIDPGLTGAIVLVCGTSVLSVQNMPIEPIPGFKKKRASNEVDGRRLTTTILSMVTPDHAQSVTVVLERTSSMPGQAAQTGYSMGCSFGVVKGVIESLGLRLVTVRPAQWKRAMALAADKRASLTMARALFPGAAITRHDHAEAALLAEWARRAGL